MITQHELLTLEIAEIFMRQLYRVPKRCTFEYCCVRIDEQGRGKVTIITPASEQAIKRWFKEVGLHITQLDAKGFYGGRSVTWQITFDVLEVGRL